MTEKAKRYYWLKLPEDWFRQKSIKRLRQIAGGDTYTIIYLKMMLQSLKTGGKLFFDGYEDTFSDEIALDIDEDPANVKVTVNYLTNAGLLVLDNQSSTSVATLPESLKLTGSESSSAERVRRFRANKTAKAVTCNADVTNCNTEKEKEIEKEIEIEIEKPSCPEPSSDDSRPEPKKRASSNKTAMAEAETEGDVFLKVPLNTGDLFWISRIWLEKQREFYPGINIELVCRQAAGWLENNPKYRKTRGGMSRFLSSWFNREQDKASKPYRKPAQTSRPSGWTSYVTPEMSDEYNALAQMISAKDRLSIRQNAERRAHENSGSEDSGEHGAAQDPDLLPGKTG